MLTSEGMLPFTFQRFADSEDDDRALLCERLARLLSHRLAGSRDFQFEAAAIVADLRAVGHDLWSFDQDDDFQIWCPDYVSRRPGSGLIVELRAPAEAVVSWESHGSAA